MMVAITDKGQALRKEAKKVPYQMGGLVNQNGEMFSSEEVKKLKEHLYQIINTLK